MSTTAHLYVIRHGRTGGNGQRYVGWEDEALDDTGRVQARAVAAALACTPIARVYASPLSRARDTAAPLAAALGVPVEIHEALKEIDYGEYHGLLKTDAPLKLRRDHRVAPMPGGESLYDVYQRVLRLARELAQPLQDGANVAIVGHFWSSRMLVAAMLGIPFASVFEQSRYKPANGSVYEIGFSCADGRLAAATQGWRLRGGEGP